MKVTLKLSDSFQKGFTLLEVMIALAVISISLTVLIHSQNASIGRTFHASSLSRAALLCRKVLSEIDMGKNINEGEWEGKEAAGNRIFSWSKRIEQSGIKGIVKVTVSVSWDGGGPFMIETYRIST